MGKHVLYGRVGHEKCGAGWFIGKVQRHGVPPRDLIRTPTANFVVAYNKKETAGTLNGQEACELSARIYGTHRQLVAWWVLLEPAAASLGLVCLFSRKVLRAQFPCTI